MMINKRLIETVSESKRYIAGNVLMQWISLLGNLVMMTTIANLLEGSAVSVRNSILQDELPFLKSS